MTRPVTNFTDVDILNDLTIHGNLSVEGSFALGNAAADDMTLAAQLIFDRTTANIIVDAADPAANSTYTIPDVGTTADFVMTAGAQTITGVKTMSGANVITHAPTGLKLQDSDASHVVTIAAGNESANRTLSIPVLGGADTVMTLGTAQSISGAKTFAGSALLLGGAGAGVATFLYANTANSRSYTVPDAGASASVVLMTAGQAVAGTLTRADLTAESLVVDSIPLSTVKELTGLQLAATASAGKFGLSQTGSFGTPSGNLLVGEDANGTTKTDYCVAYSKVPLSFVAGSNLNLQVTVGMTGAGAAVAAPNSTIDAKVYRIAADGSIGTDLCTTAAQALAASATTRTFNLNNTAVVPGDVLIIYLEMAATEGAAASAIGNISKLAVAYDTKG